MYNKNSKNTKHTHKTKDRVTRTPLKTGGEFMRTGKVGSSCSNSGIRRVTNAKLLFKISICGE